MAEVQKKVVEDKYKTGKIKKSTEKKKEVKKENVKENNKRKTKTEEKKSFITRFRIFCHGVKSEFQKVHWPTKENMVKYSIATIFFVIFCAAFFYLIDIIFAFVRSLF